MSFIRAAQMEEDASVGPSASVDWEAMSTLPQEPPRPGGHLELPVNEQLERAKLWDPAEQPVIDDLTDEEEAEFLAAIAR